MFQRRGSNDDVFSFTNTFSFPLQDFYWYISKKNEIVNRYFVHRRPSYNINMRDLKQEIHVIQSSRLLSKNLKIKIYKTIRLLVVLYGCETWSLAKGI